MTISVDKFIEFLQATPDEEVVNTTWHCCAVGEYLSRNGVEVRNSVGTLRTLVAEYDVDKIVIFEHELEATLTDTYTDEQEQVNLYDMLNDGDFRVYNDILEALGEQAHD